LHNEQVATMMGWSRPSRCISRVRDRKTASLSLGYYQAKMDLTCPAHVRPQLEALGFSSPNDMFRKYVGVHCERAKNDPARFVSIGSGNCDLEISLASHFRSSGHSNFIIDCLDLNPAMLERHDRTEWPSALARSVGDNPRILAEIAAVLPLQSCVAAL